MSDTENDPMAAILARYQRYEDQPLERLRSATRAGGMKPGGTTMAHAGVMNEIVQDGMCVGFITKKADGSGYVLELSRREVSEENRNAVGERIEQLERNARTFAAQQAQSQLRLVG